MDGAFLRRWFDHFAKLVDLPDASENARSEWSPMEPAAGDHLSRQASYSSARANRKEAKGRLVSVFGPQRRVDDLDSTRGWCIGRASLVVRQVHCDTLLGWQLHCHPNVHKTRRGRVLGVVQRICAGGCCLRNRKPLTWPRQELLARRTSEKPGRANSRSRSKNPVPRTYALSAFQRRVEGRFPGG